LPDSEHCAIIGGIADRLSSEFAPALSGGRLRFGISQKALNMYLKHLWHFGHIVQPPHCPFDSVILKALKIDDLWTESDDEHEYMKWVSVARKMAGNLSISEWECEAWLRGQVSN
jgi:hypothetical protein